MAHYIELLKNRNFVLYNIGQMVSQFADRFLQIALIGIVYKIAPGSSVQLAKMMLITLLPTFIISPVAGVLIDRVSKKNLLIVSDIIRCLTVLAIPVFFLNINSLIPTYIAVFIIFSAACFFVPAKLAIIPDLLNKENLLMANSASMASWILSGIIGFSGGAFLAEAIGIQKGLFVNSALYFLSVASLFLIIMPKAGIIKRLSLKDFEKDVEKALRKSFLYDMKEGISYLISHKEARFVTMIFFVFMSCIGSLYVVSVVFIQDVTHSMTSNIGVVGIFIFLGFLIGSYVYGKTGNKYSKSKMIFASFILSGIFVILFSVSLKVTGEFLMSCFFLFLLGASLSPIATSANTIIHETIDEKLHGRVFSFIGIIMNGGFALFMYASSVLAEHIDRLFIIIGCGCVFSLIGAAGYVLDKKEKLISPSS